MYGDVSRPVPQVGGGGRWSKPGVEEGDSSTRRRAADMATRGVADLRELEDTNNKRCGDVTCRGSMFFEKRLGVVHSSKEVVV